MLLLFWPLGLFIVTPRKNGLFESVGCTSDDARGAERFVLARSLSAMRLDFRGGEYLYGGL